jgi:hypothetical protein
VDRLVCWSDWYFGAMRAPVHSTCSYRRGENSTIALAFSNRECRRSKSLSSHFSASALRFSLSHLSLEKTKTQKGKKQAARHTLAAAAEAAGRSSSRRSRAIHCEHMMLIPASSLLYSHNRYWSPDCYGGAVVYHQPNLGGTKATSRYFVFDFLMPR